MAKEKVKAATTTGMPELVLVQERKFADLIHDPGIDRFEASGVYHLGGRCFVVFDNLGDIAQVRADLGDEPGAAVFYPQRGRGLGYEDITYNAQQKQWYCLIESEQRAKDVYASRVEVFTDSLRFAGTRWLDWQLKDPNKGFEGLCHLTLDGTDYLLALCEGNACKGGSAGREPGKGRIQVFREGDTQWDHVGTIKLPRSLPFEDYVALDVRDGQVTVLSQASSALWVGRVRADATAEDIFLDDLFEDEGAVYPFPRDAKGRTPYCNVEGVSWIDPQTLVVVSDRMKAGDQHERCATRDQSIHIFRLPLAGDAAAPVVTAAGE